MKPEVSFDKTVTTVKQGDLVHTMVKYCASITGDGALPIDVVFVIDRSGSMSGEPIVAVREAVAESYGRWDQTTERESLHSTQTPRWFYPLDDTTTKSRNSESCR